MNQLAKKFTLSACAVAASLLISACGGGAAGPDTTPPTVAITSAEGTAGAVTFYFAFSEALAAGSFTAEDVAVTGGTPGTLTMVTPLQYSLVVTPTSGATSVVATVIAGKYSDVGNLANTAVATNTYTVPTVTTGGTALVTFDEASPNISAFGGGTLTIDVGPGGSTGKVGKLVRQGGAPDGAGKVVLNARIPFTATAKTITARVWSSKAGVPIYLKVEGEAGLATVAAPITVTAANTWQTMTFDFSAVNPSGNYNVFVLMADKDTIGTGEVYYFDEITLAGASTATPTPTPSPTPSTTVLATFDGTPATAFVGFNGAEGTVIAAGPAGGTGNALKVVRMGGDPWAGAKLTGLTLNVSATNNTISARVYSPLAGKPVVLKLEGSGSTAEVQAKEAVVVGWQTLTWTIPAGDIGPVRSDVVFLPNLGTVGTGEIYYFDDVTLGGVTASPTPTPTPTEPTTAATTPTALATDVMSIYSDAFTPVAGVVLRPDWGQTTAVSEVMIAGNKTQKYTAFNYEGITFTPIDVSAMTKLHIDVWTPDLTALDVYVLAGGAEQFVKLTPTKAGWNSFDINLSDYTTLNKAAVKELKLVATGGSTLYFDNLYFSKAAGATPSPTPAPTPSGTPVAYSSGYTNPVAKGAAGAEYFEGATAEGGAWGYYSGGFPTAVGGAFTGGTADYRYIGTSNTSAPTASANGTYMGIYNLYKAGGLTTGGKGFVTVELAADADYIASGKQTLRVDVVGSELFNNGNVADCVIVASGTVKPTSAALTSYRVPITTFGQGCNQASITNVAQVLARPIGKVAITADWPNINNTVAHVGGTEAGKFITAFTLGKITFTD